MNYRVLNQQDFNSNTESDEEEIKIIPEEGLKTGYKYLEFFTKIELYFWTGGNNHTKTPIKIIDNKLKLKQTQLNISIFKKINSNCKICSKFAL